MCITAIYDLSMIYSLYLHHLRVYYELTALAQLVTPATPLLQKSWVRIPFKAEFFSGFNSTTTKVMYITAMITHVLIPFSAVQIYDLVKSLFVDRKRANWLLCTVLFLLWANKKWKKSTSVYIFSKNQDLFSRCYYYYYY